MTPAARRPLDQVLVQMGDARDVEHARELIARGRVTVSGAPALSGTRLVAPSDAVVVREPRRFVSRGGDKLEGALARLGIEVDGHAALDAGASTGGFTDCLLAHGARAVLAVDVGHHQLHERLAADGRVVSLEDTNVRHLTAADVGRALGSAPTVVVADLSFTSLATAIQDLVGLAAPHATLLLLVKPQFEADHVTVSKSQGVLRDPDAWRDALERCASALDAAGAGIMGAMPSPIRGAAGNVEFFLYATADAPRTDTTTRAALLDQALREAAEL